MIRGIKYISLAETTGYGISAMDYIRALSRAGIPITWHPLIMTRSGYRPATEAAGVEAALATMSDVRDLTALFHAPVDYDTVIVHLTPEHWPGTREPGKRMIGYTVWETDTLPLHWPPLFDGFHRILTPSTFSQNVFARRTDVPVIVVPHLPRAAWPTGDAAERNAFRRRLALDENVFVFYTINTWILRKAIWLTIHAFLLAFEADDRVALVVKTNPHGESHDAGWVSSRRLFDAVMSNYDEPARVVFVPEELTYDDVGRLHQAGDAYVSLAHSEGFGLGAFDAATAGTPVMTTGWSGPLDFLPDEDACLVRFKLKKVIRHLGNHTPQEQHWAHADIDHAIEWMRYLYEHPHDARARGERLKAGIAGRFDSGDITKRLVQALYD